MDRRVNRQSAGFTLIELMIVITVLALLTTTVSLSANRPRTALASDFGRFRAVHDRLRDQAVLSRQIMGLAVDADGYQRLRWDGQDWQPLGAPVRWRGQVLMLSPSDARAPLQFAPSGQATPLRLRFDDGARVMLCQADGWSAVSCAR